MPVVVYTVHLLSLNFGRTALRLGWVFVHHNVGDRPVGRMMPLPEVAVQRVAP